MRQLCHYKQLLGQVEGAGLELKQHGCWEAEPGCYTTGQNWSTYPDQPRSDQGSHFFIFDNVKTSFYLKKERHAK